MGRAHKPRSGSLAYYPRGRAKRHNSSFSTYPIIQTEGAKPLNYFGYKTGMVQLFGKNAHEKSTGFGQEVSIPSTLIECPPIKIMGVRVYGKKTTGLMVLGEATIEKPGKNLRKKIKAFKKPGKKTQKTGEKKEKNYTTFSDLEKLKEKANKVVLLAEVQPGSTGMGKKKPDLGEINLTGTIDEQYAFAKEKFGKELLVTEAFENNEFIDVKAVDKGKGFTGPVKRFGIKIQRPKAKKHRAVGSISPWHPATVMWTVARAGQHGYQTRTEYNKRIIIIQNNSKPFGPKGGFTNYGVVKNDYLIVTGSVPGSSKRPIALRHAIRKAKETLAKYTDIKIPFEIEETKTEKPKEEKSVKEEKETKEEIVEKKKEAKEGVKETPKEKKAEKETKKEEPKAEKEVKKKESKEKTENKEAKKK